MTAPPIQNRMFSKLFMPFYVLVTLAQAGIPTIVSAATTLTTATGGSAIDSSTVGGTWTSLTGPILSGIDDNDMSASSGTLSITAPTGFEFDTTGTAPRLRVNGGTSNNNVNNLANNSTIATSTWNSTTISFTITDDVDGGTNTLTWENVRVRPTAAAPLASGNIVLSGFTFSGLGTANVGFLQQVNPNCSGKTVYVNGSNTIVGGPMNGLPFSGMLVGTSGTDIIDGTSSADYIDGMGGADVICGHNGNDILNGGDGDDTIYGDNQADSIFGGAGADTLYGGNDGDVIYGGNDNDTIDGENGSDSCNGGSGTNTVTGCGDTQAAVITIVKNAVPDSAQNFTYVTNQSLPDFLLDDDTDATLLNNWTSAVSTSAQYTFQESSVSGWTVSSITCNGAGVDTTVNQSTAARTATVNADSGEEVTCTFVNTQSAVSTTTTLESNLNPSTVGSSVTFKATVAGSSPTGTIKFLDGASELSTVAMTGSSASLVTSSLTAGTHSIVAVYSGDGLNLTSTSSTLSQVVNKNATTTTLITSGTPVNFGTSVTFTATVTGFVTPTGTVTFKDGAAVIGTGTLVAGVATMNTSSLSVGTHQITATYNGDASDAASTSLELAQSIVAILDITTTSPLNDAVVGHSYSATFAATGGSGSYVWSLGSGSTLPAGLSFSSGGVLSGIPTTEGEYSFCIQVQDALGNIACETFAVHINNGGNADLSIDKSGPTGVLAGTGTFSYTVTVTNTGATATNIVMTDEYPAEMEYIAGSAPEEPCSEVGGDVVCTHEQLLAGESVTFTLEFQLNEPSCGIESPLLVNTASVIADQDDADMDNNSDDASTHVFCDSSEVADLTIAKSGPSQAQPNETITYHIAVANSGTGAASNIMVSDRIPAGLTYNDTNENCSTEGGFVFCEVAETPASLDLSFTVDNDASCGSTITNTATVSGDYEYTDAGNSASTQLTVNCVPESDFEIDKSGPSVVEFGDDITYTITVTNNGPDDGSVVAIDHFPVGLTFESSSIECDLEGGEIACGFALANGESETFTITFSYVAESCELTSFQNWASVDSKNQDPNETNDISETVVTQLICPSGGESSSSSSSNPNVSNDLPSTHLGHRTNEIWGALNGNSPRLPNDGNGLPPGGFGGGEDTPFTEEQFADICSAKVMLDRIGYTEGLLRWTVNFLLDKYDLSDEFDNDIYQILSTGEGCY